jgi:hypothetical protein
VFFDDGSGPCRDISIDGNYFSFAKGARAEACVTYGAGTKALKAGKNVWAMGNVPHLLEA